jgi:hypothetical protein
MAVYSFYTIMYTKQIYLAGSQRFTARDGCTGINEEYHTPVKEYAAANLMDYEIEFAKEQGYINETEYAETMSIKYPA